MSAISAISGPTPWWGTLVTALIALGAVIVAQWLASARERRRIELDLKDRQYDRVLEAYVEFLAAGQDMALTTTLVDNERRQDAIDDLIRVRTKLMLLGSKHVREVVTESLGGLSEFPSAPEGSDHIQACSDQILSALRRIETVMRNDLDHRSQR